MTAIFETPRLIVRRWTAADAAAFAVLQADPDVRRFNDWAKAPGAFAAACGTSAARTPPDAQGWINMAVVERATGAAVGDHGLRVEGATAWLGLSLVPAARRRWLGAELVLGSAHWLRAAGVARAVAEIDCDNAASFALFASLGFAVEAEACDDKGPYRILSAPTEELSQLRSRVYKAR